MSFVTLKGINNAVSNLAPRLGTLQERLLSILLSSFSTEASLTEITSISSDELVKALWDVDSLGEIRKKKKNLSSLKSAINKRFKELTDLDQNPEGLIIGKDNIFTISEEHKNSLLSKLGISSGSDPAMDFFASMRGVLNDIAAGGDPGKLQAMLSELDKTKEIINRLIQGKDGGTGTCGEEGGSEGSQDVEKIELEENEEIIVVGGRQSGQSQTDSEAGDSGGTAEYLESNEFESEKIYEDIAEDEELVEELVKELIEDEEFLEVPEEEEDLPEGEGDESSEGLGGDAGAGIAADAGGQAGSIAGTAGEGQGGELTELGSSDVTDLLDGSGPDSAHQEIEVLEDEELVEELLGDEIDEEIIEEEDILDEEEIFDDEVIAEKLVEDEELPEAEGDKSPEGPGEGAGAGIAADAGGQTGTIAGTAGEGQGGDLTELGPGDGPDPLDESGPDSAHQEIKVLEDKELVEELLDDGIDEKIIEEEDVLDEEEIFDDQDLLELSEEDIAEEEEADLIAQEDGIKEGMSSSGEDKKDGPPGRPLELSRYIDPSEALENLPDTLNESNDELISMIMQRFLPPFIQVSAGSYLVGSKHPRRLDRSEQTITLKDFHISQIPVTNDIFDFFIRETGYETDAEKKGYGTVVEGRFSRKTDPDTGKETLVINPGIRFQRVEGATWRHPKGPHNSLENKASHPVVQVSRRDATAFASWAGKKLPSEDEWEAAARGRAGLLFPWGDKWFDTYGNFESSQLGDTTPVTHYGKVSMSPFGVLDMLGNILEWTSSRPLDVGDDGTAPWLSILKGGSWATAGIITAATRFLEGDNTWSNIIGFRCAV